ncbi:MAG: HD domain-containing protein [Candidatus Nanosyncoccaceae bacterium]
MSKSFVEKVDMLVKIYNIVAKLKEMPRAGWHLWHIQRETLESVADHIFGVCILAILIDSEFEVDADINRVLKMLVLHELDELFIGDITPYDGVKNRSEIKKHGEDRATNLLADLVKAEEYIKLVKEYNRGETKEAKFAKQCDKLEATLQAKLYDSDTNIFSPQNQSMLKAEHLKEISKNPQAQLSDTFFAYYEFQNSFEGLFKQIIDEINK